MQKETRILCCRELQNSIKDSVLQLLKEQVEMCGLSEYFESGVNYLKCKTTGSEFLFKGLRANSQEIKSTEGVGICWVEEAQGVSEDSWKWLVPTIREEGSEIWVSFNPDLETDPTYQRFVLSQPPNSIVRKVNFSDNPWFPDVLKQEMEYLRRVDADAYAHVWEGACRFASAAQVLYGKITIDQFDPQQDWDGPYYGADWGFSVDPTALVKSWIGGRTLYVEYEAWAVHCDIDATPGLFDTVPGSRNHIIRADNARPETISYMNKAGFRIHPATKGKGSVEDGIAQLRSFEQIVIHPRCVHTIQEARTYRYKTDRLTNDVLPVLIDADNHTIDAIRYSLEPLLGGTSKPVEVEVNYHNYGASGWMA